MTLPIKVGIVGDYNPELPYHIATKEALEHAAASLSIPLASIWVPSQALTEDTVGPLLRQFDAIWSAPGDYISRDGVFLAIKFAREQGWPFIGTCAGFQHAVLEYARHVLGINDAEHEETSPNAQTLVINKLVCSLAGLSQTVKITPGSRVHNAYGREESIERFACNYGLNPLYQDKIQDGRLQAAGVDKNGEVRIIEMSDHPFFIGTLYMPQLTSLPGTPHPLIVSFLDAARTFQGQKKS